MTHDQIAALRVLLNQAQDFGQEALVNAGRGTKLELDDPLREHFASESERFAREAVSAALHFAALCQDVAKEVNFW
jgi:hypothetical protein